MCEDERCVTENLPSSSHAEPASASRGWGGAGPQPQLAQVLNPSMAVHNGFVYLVALRYLEEWRTQLSTHLGAAVTERTLIRHTHVVSRKLHFNASGWLGWSAASWGMDAEMVDVDVRASMASDQAGWPVCELEPLQLANATLLRTVTTGPVRPFASLPLPFRPTLNSPAFCLLHSTIQLLLRWIFASPCARLCWFAAYSTALAAETYVNQNRSEPFAVGSVHFTAVASVQGQWGGCKLLPAAPATSQLRAAEGSRFLFLFGGVRTRLLPWCFVPWPRIRPIRI